MNKSILTMLLISTIVISLSIAICTTAQTESDGATTVTDFDGLKSAIENADSEGIEIILDGNITTSESIVIDEIDTDTQKVVDINLNGHVLTFQNKSDSDTAYITVKHAKLTLSGSGTVTSDGTTINMFGSTGSKSNYSILEIGENVTLSGMSTIIIDNGQRNNTGVVVNISGTLESIDNSSAITIDETATRTIGTVPRITVSSTGTVDAKEGIGIHSAGFGHWYIHGTVKGDIAATIDIGRIYVYEGANIEGGNTFTAPTSGESTSAGGIGILLMQSASYSQAYINAGTVSGAYALYESDLDDDHSGIVIQIKDGSFIGKIYSQSIRNFIEGGSFSTEISEDYINSSYRMDSDPDGEGFIIRPIDSGAIRIGTTYYTTLANAVEDCGSRDVIEILDDISIEPLSIYKKVNIELNGNTITISEGNDKVGISFANGDSAISNGSLVDGRTTSTSGGFTAISVSTGALTITDVALTIENAPNTISANNVGYQVLTAGTLNLCGNSSIIAEKTYGSYHSAGVIVIGSEEAALSTPTTLNIQDRATIDVGQFGISGNGSPGDGDTVIDLSGNARITVSNGWGIYHPQIGILNISDDVLVSGMTGVEMRSGIANISGGTIESTAKEVDIEPNGGGPSVNGGVAFAIDQHATNLPISVNITGGTLIGPTALYEADLMDDDVSDISIEISGGTFKGNVTSDNVDGFVKGGSFDSDVSDYVPEGFECSFENGAFVIENNSDMPQNPGWDDDELPPFIPSQDSDDDTVTIVACAAAAAVAAIMAVFLIIDRKK